MTGVFALWSRPLVSEPTPWSGARRAVPHFAFVAQSWQRVRHREEPLWTYGTGCGSDTEVEKQVLSSAQRQGGLSCSRALPCAWWAAPWHPCVLLRCWPWAFPQWELVSPCPLRSHHRTLGDPGDHRWPSPEEGGLVSVCGSSDEAMSVSQMREQPTWYISSPGTYAPGQHWVVGQVPFSSLYAPLTCPQDTCDFDEGTMRTSAFAFSLRLHFCLNFSAFDFQSLVLVIQQD